MGTCSAHDVHDVTWCSMQLVGHAVVAVDEGALEVADIDVRCLRVMCDV